MSCAALGLAAVAIFGFVVVTFELLVCAVAIWL